ncbi:MAG: SPOR domain-containing protein [Pseudomonadota bacterium]
MAKSRGDWPWGLMLVILVSGVIIGMLVNGAQRDDAGFGQGLKAMWESVRSDATEVVKETQSTQSTTVDASTEQTSFDYYELLRDIEKVMPDTLLNEGPVAQRDGYDYYLQVASFRQQQDAEEVRASLALNGIESETQAREVEGKGLYYRIRLGPFENKRVAKNSKTRLQKLGYEPFVFRIKND